MDVDQAIGAKVHLGLHVLSLMPTAQLVVVDPSEVEALPPWSDDEALYAFAAEAQLPASPVFFDFEAENGRPVMWRADGWPLPFHLRGALCWTADGLLSVVPFGSVGGAHPWGGTDYQAWARWVFVQRDASGPELPGPGDVVVWPDGRGIPWVDTRLETVCLHQATVALHLVSRVLRLLWAMELFEAKVVPPTLPRPERRRAKRAGQQIGLVIDGLPRVSHEPHAAQSSSATDIDRTAAMTQRCPIPGTHATLNDVHVLWHEALDAYNDPALFATKLNALIQALRNVTFALQKELAATPGLTEEWYAEWQTRLREDPRMRGVVEARNTVVKRGGLDSRSMVKVRVVGEGFAAKDFEFEVDPATPTSAIARELAVRGVDRRVRRHGTLVVERRWTVDAFPDEEVLDVLAHAYGVLWQLVAEAHELATTPLSSCEVSADDPCIDDPYGLMTPSGRPGCMWAGREARTSRRDLDSGAPTGVVAEPMRGQPPTEEAIVRRYGKTPWSSVNPSSDVFEKAARLHEDGRRMFLVDGEHVMISWLLRDGEPLSQQGLWPEDRRAKFLMLEQLAAEATRLGANELILTAEAWEAEPLPPEDPRAMLPAAEREDRTEALVTHALRRNGGWSTWRSPIVRTDDRVDLEPVIIDTTTLPPIFKVLLDRWAEWPAGDEDGS